MLLNENITKNATLNGENATLNVENATLNLELKIKNNIQN